MAWFHKGKTELNNPVPKEPFFFLKPISSTLANGGTIQLPKGTICNHEVELGVVIGRKATSLTQENAMNYVKGYCLAIDMTARNMQDVAKKAGLPWTAVKGFDTFCPISDFIPADKVKDPHKLHLKFEVDGQVKQDGPTSDLMFSVPRQLQHVTSIMTLDEDDILLTGTPPAGAKGASQFLSDRVWLYSVLQILATLSQDGQELARWQGDTKERQDGYAFSA